METTLKFTRANLKGLIWREGTKQTLYWDTGEKGLGLRVTKGKKVFIYEQRLHGKTIRISYKNEQDLDLARKWATEQRAEFNDGNDPREILKEKGILGEERKAQAKAQADREKIFVKQAWDDYIEHQKALMPLKGLAKGKKWGERHLTDHLNMVQPAGLPHKRGKKVSVQGVLYPLLGLKLAEVSPSLLKDWLNKERATRPNNARQGFQMFRTFWNWCAKDHRYKAIVNRDAVADDSLIAIIPSKKSKLDVGDLLRANYVKDWFYAIQNISNKFISTYLQCLLLTGARENEMIGLKWSDVDFKGKVVWIKDKMKDEGRFIPLNPYMEFLIKSLDKKNDYVFYSKTAKEGHISVPTKAHTKALLKAEIPHFSIHGLRRSFTSLFLYAGQPDGAGARIQGHKAQSIRDKHYLELPIELLAKWLDGYVNWLLNEAGIPLPVEEAKGLGVV